MTSAEAAPKSNRSALLVVFLVVFIDLLGFGIVLPLVPLVSDGYLVDYSQGQKDLAIGLLFSLFSLMQFVFSPVWGRLSDRIGRRPILLMSLGGSVVFYALFAVACAIPTDMGLLAVGLMLLSRIGAGIAGASVSTASAVIADSTTPENRAKGMGLIGAAFGIGFTFGPLLAFAVLSLFPDPASGEAERIGIDPKYAWIPAATASCLSLLSLLLAVLRMPETLKPGTTPHADRRGFSLTRSADVLKMPSVGPLILMYFLAIFAFANFEATLSRFTKDVFGFNVKQNFLVFAGVGCVLMVAQGGFYRRFAGKMNELSLLRAGLVMMFLGLGGMGTVAYLAWQVKETGGTTSPFQWQLYLAAGVAVFGFAFVNPSVAGLVSRRADPTRQGEVLGVNQSFTAIGRILGPLLGNLVYGIHPSHALPFAAAVGVLLIVVLLLPVAGREPTPPTASEIA